MKKDTERFDVPDQFIDSVLTHSGIVLNDAQKRALIPQFRSQMEQSLALYFFSLLGEADKTAYEALLSDETKTAEDWQKFWTEHIKDFDTELENGLVAFAKSVQELATQ